MGAGFSLFAVVSVVTMHSLRSGLLNKQWESGEGMGAGFSLDAVVSIVTMHFSRQTAEQVVPKWLRRNGCRLFSVCCSRHSLWLPYTLFTVDCSAETNILRRGTAQFQFN